MKSWKKLLYSNIVGVESNVSIIMLKIGLKIENLEIAVLIIEARDL